MIKTKKVKNDALQKEVQNVRGQIRSVENAFRYATEPHLINACIYELKALDSRYEYLREEMGKTGRIIY